MKNKLFHQNIGFTIACTMIVTTSVADYENFSYHGESTEKHLSLQIAGFSLSSIS